MIKERHDNNLPENKQNGETMRLIVSPFCDN